VTTPHPLGVSAVEWLKTPFSQHDILSSIESAFYGTVIKFQNDRNFLVTDA
jgi:hypothetical protein